MGIESNLDNEITAYNTRLMNCFVIDVRGGR